MKFEVGKLTKKCFWFSGFFVFTNAITKCAPWIKKDSEKTCAHVKEVAKDAANLAKKRTKGAVIQVKDKVKDAAQKAATSVEGAAKNAATKTEKAAEKAHDEIDKRK